MKRIVIIEVIAGIALIVFFIFGFLTMAHAGTLYPANTIFEAYSDTAVISSSISYSAYFKTSLAATTSILMLHLSINSSTLPKPFQYKLECSSLANRGFPLGIEENVMFQSSFRQPSSTYSDDQFFTQSECGTGNDITLKITSEDAQSISFILWYAYVETDLLQDVKTTSGFTYGEIVLTIFSFLIFTLLFYGFLWYTTTRKKETIR